MVHGRTRVAAVGLLLLLSSVRLAEADSIPDAKALAPKRKVIEQWVADAKLSDRLEVVKLRRSTHPDPAADDRQGVRLEFLFRTKENDESKADADFVAFMSAQSDAAGQPFADRCLYKLAHLLALRREDVSVHFNVSEVEYVVFFDSASRKVVTQRGPKRGAIRRTVSIIRSPGTLAQTATVAGGEGRKLAQSIRSFIEASWRAAGTGVAFEPLEDDYLAFSVDGFKKQIIRSHDYWETLQVSIEMRPTASGWKLTCYFDGQYAAGLGSRRPSSEAYADMDADFRSDLNAYAMAILGRLQQHLERQR
jgi:hypothetical protein